MSTHSSEYAAIIIKMNQFSGDKCVMSVKFYSEFWTGSILSKTGNIGNSTVCFNANQLLFEILNYLPALSFNYGQSSHPQSPLLLFLFTLFFLFKYPIIKLLV